MTGYCLKCREPREMQDAEQVTMKNGWPATRGTCGECGNGMYRTEKGEVDEVRRLPEAFEDYTLFSILDR